MKVLLGTRQLCDIGVWWNSLEGATDAGHLRFRRSDVVNIFPFFYFSLGLGCVVCPSVGLAVVSSGRYINIAGRKIVPRRLYKNDKSVDLSIVVYTF